LNEPDKKERSALLQPKTYSIQIQGKSKGVKIAHQDAATVYFIMAMINILFLKRQYYEKISHATLFSWMLSLYFIDSFLT
jgi:hypothetical protein